MIAGIALSATKFLGWKFLEQCFIPGSSVRLGGLVAAGDYRRALFGNHHLDASPRPSSTAPGSFNCVNSASAAHDCFHFPPS
jgi:hypothetical protein